MEIVKACQAIRHCNDSFVFGVPMRGTYGEVVEAVRAVKAYLELVRGDGKAIHELGLNDYLLCTPEGMTQVMPFVYSAESIANAGRRHAHFAG